MHAVPANSAAPPPVTRRQFGIGGILSLGLGGRKHEHLTGIRFRRISRGGSDRRYLVIHGDEQTAREVLLDHMNHAKGKAYLVENSTRNVEVRGGKVDPNRLFSNVGLERNLQLLNPSAAEAWIASAVVEIQNSRHELVNAVMPPNGSVLIVLHNNASSYSVKSEVPISDQVALNDPDNPHDFGLCTSASDFATLSKGPYNMVLQNYRPSDDDGSLSRLAARMGFRYLNLEARIGNLNKQKDMLNWVESVLS